MEDEIAGTVQLLLNRREDTAKQLSDYLQFQSSLALLEPQITTQVNLGCEFFVQAKASTKSIRVKTPIADLWIEMSLSDAAEFTTGCIEVLHKRLEIQSEAISIQRAQHKAYIETLRVFGQTMDDSNGTEAD